MYTIASNSNASMVIPIYTLYLYVLEQPNVYGTMFPLWIVVILKLCVVFKSTHSVELSEEREKNSEERKPKHKCKKEHGLCVESHMCGRSDRLKISTYWKTNDWEKNEHNSTKHFISRKHFINLDDFSRRCEWNEMKWNVKKSNWTVSFTPKCR